MSCGLGAIILVFMLVKYNEDTSIPEREVLKAEAARLQAAETALAARRGVAQQAYEAKEQQVAETSENLARIQSAQKTARHQEAKKQAELEGMKKDVEKISTARTEDMIKVKGSGEENYLIGLKVEGARIALLIDSSASMTDPHLIDIIRRKNSPDHTKMAGPKWKRTLAIVRWLLARLPASAQVMAITFNEQARRLGSQLGSRSGNQAANSGWVKAGDQAALKAITGELGRVVPSGATNLQSALEAVKAHASPDGPTNIYLITDGLPTSGTSRYKSLNPFSHCSALWGGSSKISGACRLALFQHTLDSSAPPSSIPVNVILLPLEGDPHAAPAFWSWSASTGGLMISPAETWP